MVSYMQTLPDLAACDFTRFDFYAPLVKRFTRRYDNHECVTDPGVLTSYAHHRTLLPNLQCLEFPAGLSTLDHFWANVLLSPTLLIFQTGLSFRSSSIGIEMASITFEDITIRCPALRVLDLYYAPSMTRQPIGLVDSPTLLIHQHVGAMQNLRVLCATTVIFEATSLQILGTLPFLHRIEIHGTSPLPLPLPLIELPQDSFPALRSLRLSTLKVNEFRSIWNIRPLLARLVTAQLYINEPYADQDLSMLLLDVCQRSPHIANLELAYPKAEIKYMSLSINFFWSLRHLSLERLNTSGMRLPPAETTCHSLSIACPLLRTLKTGTWPVSVPDLRYFAQLSRLEYLKASIGWMSCADLNKQNLRLPWVSESFRRLKWSSDPGVSVEPKLIKRTTMYVLIYIFVCSINLSSFQRFLLSFWPNLSSVCMRKKLSVPHLEFSTPWLVNDQLQAERAARRCQCTICLRRIAEDDCMASQ